MNLTNETKPSCVFSRTAFLALAAAMLVAGAGAGPAGASSHMDAPLITFDDAANTTDVYAFVSERDGTRYLTTALAVYPFEEPGIGPNKYNFDDNVRYQIHIATGADVARGRPTISYRFEFETRYKNENTILQSFLDVIDSVDDAGQNLTQTYTVTKVERRVGEDGGSDSGAVGNRETVLGTGVVPPNNQGVATPRYNLGEDGESPAKDGVATAAELDPYTAQSIADLGTGYLAFAGQRDDGFYADIQSIFDLLALRSDGSSFDSQGGFNVHTIVLDIPLDDLGGDMQVVGVYATTSRRRTSVIRRNGREDDKRGRFRQVARQGNPLFNEALVAIADKDLYSRTSPRRDAQLFARYAERPEIAALINQIMPLGVSGAIETDRTDLVAIFIPDMIRVDLSTPAVPLAGGGLNHATNPDDEGFSRLGIFGGDTVPSQIQAGLLGDGMVPSGWPNGRRFGDDVIDITISAVLSDLRDPDNLVIVAADGVDSVDSNDIAYNKVFPYAATPLNGRNHEHH